MTTYNFCFLGFGNVGRALVRLLVAKSNELRDGYGIEWKITGVATRRLGWLSAENGVDAGQLLTGNLNNLSTHTGITDWLHSAQPAVVFETTSLNPENRSACDRLSARLTTKRSSHDHGQQRTNRLCVR
jgi:homoserine dehydrogenase